MSRTYNIRWKQSDNEELRKAVKNFNAKIDRLTKKDPKNKILLPERVSVREMRDLIRTRQDLKREINALKRFSKRGMETGVKAPITENNIIITKWQRQEMLRRTANINRKRKKRLQEVMETPLKSRGKELEYKKSQMGMGRTEEIELTPMNAFTRKMDKYDLREKFKHIMKESKTDYWDWRDHLLKQSYITSLEQNFAPADVEDIIDRIDQMEINEFKKIYYEEDALFELSYPGDKEDEQKHLNALKTIWIPNKRG